MQKRSWLQLIFGVVLTALVVAPLGVVFAQTAVSTGLSAESIFLKRFNSEESQRLIRLYQDQFEQYRQTERDFITAQAQYTQLNTLAALEKAVVSSREIMLKRADILITYQELLAASLVESVGVELSLKMDTLRELQSDIESLKKIRTTIASSSDKYAIQAANTEFESVLVPELYSVAYKTLSQLVVADVQNIFDKTRQVYVDVQAELAKKQVTNLQMEERKRAIAEVDTAIKTVETDLRLITERVVTTQTFDDNFYGRLVGDLQSIYGSVGQVITYIEELEKTTHE